MDLVGDPMSQLYASGGGRIPKIEPSDGQQQQQRNSWMAPPRLPTQQSQQQQQSSPHSTQQHRKHFHLLIASSFGNNILLFLHSFIDVSTRSPTRCGCPTATVIRWTARHGSTTSRCCVRSCSCCRRSPTTSTTAITATTTATNVWRFVANTNSTTAELFRIRWRPDAGRQFTR